tara:strand:- start:457 stop:930 length:474 start_codon:yes stop_codon:yes gene_type:complete
MDINDQDIYQGVVFLKALRQVEELSTDLNYKIRSGTSKNSFLIEGEKTRTVGIYVKYTKKPRSPWSFSFIQEHQEEIEVLAEVCNEVLITFVCHYDGIVCLTYKELKEVLDETFEESERVSIRRKARGNYWVKGRDGRMEASITRNDLGKKIMEALD